MNKGEGGIKITPRPAWSGWSTGLYFANFGVFSNCNLQRRFRKVISYKTI